MLQPRQNQREVGKPHVCASLERCSSRRFAPEGRHHIGRRIKNFNKDLLLSLSQVQRWTCVQAHLLTNLQNSFMLARKSHEAPRCVPGGDVRPA